MFIVGPVQVLDWLWIQTVAAVSWPNTTKPLAPEFFCVACILRQHNCKNTKANSFKAAICGESEAAPYLRRLFFAKLCLHGVLRILCTPCGHLPTFRTETAA